MLTSERLIPSPICTPVSSADGDKTWYVFSCPNPICKKKIDMNKKVIDFCRNCGQQLDWKYFIEEKYIESTTD